MLQRVAASVLSKHLAPGDRRPTRPQHAAPDQRRHVGRPPCPSPPGCPTCPGVPRAGRPRGARAAAALRTAVPPQGRRIRWCRATPSRKPNRKPQVGHAKGRSRRWTTRTCLFLWRRGGGRGGGEGGGKPSAIARAAAAAGSQEHPQTCQTSMCGASKTRPAVEGGEAGRVPHGKTATLGLWGRAHRGVVSKGDRTAAVGLPNRAKKENCRVLPRAGRHTGGREKKREPHSHGQAVTAANVPVPNFPKRLPTLGAVEGTCPVMNGPHVLAVKVSPHPRPQQPPRSPQPPPHMQQGVGETQSTEASTSKSVSALDSAAARHTTRPLVRESRAPWQVDSSDRRAPPPGGASARRPSNQRGRGEPARRPGRPAQGRWTRTLAGRCRQAAPSRPPRLAVRPPLSPRHPPPQ